MPITHEHLALVLFIVAIVGIAFGMLVALLLLFRDEQRGVKPSTHVGKPLWRFI
jgi:hypothetical protein